MKMWKKKKVEERASEIKRKQEKRKNVHAHKGIKDEENARKER